MSYKLTWRDCLGGQLALGHKPGKALRDQLEQTGCTLVVSLLSASESRADSSDHRLRIPLVSADPPDVARDQEVLAGFDHIRHELAKGGKVYIHCSAGLHRTGMMAYAFLRCSGGAGTEAIALIRELRPLTADELTEARMAWGERLASHDRRI